MRTEDLPKGNSPAPVPCPHFPARWQAVVWRNWGLVAPARIAAVLECTEDKIREAASALGLPPDPPVNPKWLSHGYQTLIRNNWHLLPYDQLLQLLGWDADKMAYTLKEEDFLLSKMGHLKPECPKLVWSELSAAQKSATDRIRQILNRYFTPDQLIYKDEPFSFLDRFAPVKPVPGRKERFEFNFIHAYSASCGDVLGNADRLDPVPENLLSQYESMGIQGVWMHALLYLLFPIPGAEEYSAGHEKRMENLKRIVARCAKHHLKVYLYLNEPRCMPLDFYQKKPLWGGVELDDGRVRAVCTTKTPEVLTYLEESLKKLFTEAKGLGGIFCITMSENATNCHSRFDSSRCPSCRRFDPAKIIADVITAMEKGMHAADPEAKMIAYDWAWIRKREPDGGIDPEGVIAFKKDVIDLLPKSVCIQSVSEWGMMAKVGGVEHYLRDYSISQVGPSRESLEVWNHALKAGLKVAAKVQINNSWELSAIPYIPVPYLIQEHLDNLKKAGVSGLMLSWTLGGFPGGNLELLHASPEEIAAFRYNPAAAREICKAWKLFSEAFRQFPFSICVAYTAPQNFGPMCPLFLEKTGYSATMIGFPYDALHNWRGHYSEDIFENQFRLLTDGWKEGLDVLKKCAPLISSSEEKKEFHELATMAEAAYCHFYSTLQQIRFIRARDNSFDREKMKQCAQEEIATALRLHEIARCDSRIGFEASNHYFYSLNDLREKIICCESILDRLNSEKH